MSSNNTPPDDPFKFTIETYDQVAPDYVKRHKTSGWWDQPNPGMIQFQPYLPANALVLDLGCGPGEDVLKIGKAGHRVVGMDLSWGMLSQARSYVGGSVAQADMRVLPVASGRLDAVWLNASLLHLPRQDAPQALGEIYRVLQPEGLLYLSVKQGQGEGYQYHLGKRYYTFYESDELHSLVTSQGFQLVETWTRDAGDTTWLAVIARKA
ncbi:MAG: class I SAM-dependent methyltransferase [Anaerolineae bacterium]|nr:class I SAM-dependent methyltransferase [Anaerolineae bacterium]